ncbi:hypothetical protein C8T65DRAFT_644055 [Cerioporus squamosus]|nr:hypothetical protein C8T65DRAFT_643957 [Cerioporus squamosus]KAI0715529.1 hypothetical protein C8T65DRAFT_644055 [Cerioporus squamosus]
MYLRARLMLCKNSWAPRIACMLGLSLVLLGPGRPQSGQVLRYAVLSTPQESPSSRSARPCNLHFSRGASCQCVAS